MASLDNDRPNFVWSQLGVTRRNREIKVRHLETPFHAKSRSASPKRSISDHLYEKAAETDLLNFVNFLSEEDVVVEREIPLTDARHIGLGSTLEVYLIAWKDQVPRVAVKHMRRDYIPKRSANLPLEQDTAYRKAERLFYHDVKSIMQEILVMSRDHEEEYFTNHLFPPLIVVELAHQETPTLEAYYKMGLETVPYDTAPGFIADIADGLSALHTCGVIHGDLKPENVLLFDDPVEKGSLIVKLCDFGFFQYRIFERSCSW
ncbi:MAG: hypothetical protein MMC33_007882 [Icmadophila ericetorum]|nr:hypothetical protein [Icmadophila ericetorum]